MVCTSFDWGTGIHNSSFLLLEGSTSTAYVNVNDLELLSELQPVNNNATNDKSITFMLTLYIYFIEIQLILIDFLSIFYKKTNNNLKDVKLLQIKIEA